MQYVTNMLVQETTLLYFYRVAACHATKTALYAQQWLELELN